MKTGESATALGASCMVLIMKKLLSLLLVFAVVGTVVFFLTPKTPPPPSAPLGAVSLEPTYFAEVDKKSGVVLRVIVANQSFIDSGKVGDPKNWIETTMDGSKRKNYARVGYEYNKTLDAFVPPKPTKDAVFDASKAKWVKSTPAVEAITASTTSL